MWSGLERGKGLSFWELVEWALRKNSKVECSSNGDVEDSTSKHSDGSSRVGTSRGRFAPHWMPRAHGAAMESKGGECSSRAHHD